MIQTNTQYMSDPARVERVIRRFMNITLQEMKRMQTRDYTGYITDKLTLTEGLSPEKLPNMSYVELACLIDSVGGKEQYGSLNYDSWAQQMTFYQCLAGILSTGNRRSIPVRLFMALPLQAFYAWLNRMCGRGSLTFSALRSRCSYRNGYTIGDFLAEKIDRLNSPWRPVIPLSAYKTTITGAHKDIGIVLVKSFRMAFPRQFDAAEICSKYALSPQAEDAGQPLRIVTHTCDSLPSIGG